MKLLAYLIYHFVCLLKYPLIAVLIYFSYTGSCLVGATFLYDIFHIKSNSYFMFYVVAGLSCISMLLIYLLLLIISSNYIIQPIVDWIKDNKDDFVEARKNKEKTPCKNYLHTLNTMEGDYNNFCNGCINYDFCHK